MICATSCMRKFQKIDFENIYTLVLTCFFLGVMCALGHAPFHWIPLFGFGIIGFLWLLPYAQTPRKAFATGYAFGMGYYCVGLYWIGIAPGEVGLWYVVPFGIVGPPLLLSTGIGFVAASLQRLCHNPLTRALGLTIGWCSWEWIMGHAIFGGFPWNMAGYIWTLPALQITSVIGIYGLSFLTLFSFSLFSTKRKSLCFLALTLLAGNWIWGELRLKTYQGLPAEAFNIRLVQPSIPQNKKWSYDDLHDNLVRQILLSQIAGEKPLNAIIWSESAIPFFVEQQHILRTTLQKAVPPGGVLIFGAPRLDPSNDALHVSLFVINEHVDILNVYDKTHLVPFGEYVPLKKILPITKLTHGSRDFTPGSQIRTIRSPQFPPFSPLICFEAIFPSEVVDSRARPQWLLNITNDAWFGHSTGPYQHLQNVRVRAIEEGLPLVRSANNGISGVIDPVGRILYQLQLDEVGYIDFHLPSPIATTLYGTYHDLFFWALMSALSLWLVLMLAHCNLKIRREKTVCAQDPLAT